ncbi:hypothetical protein MJO29_002873 [Puccinia striiformis f. sp. tritici]|nr:hypothetical protein MJO29_002873 [Puccinia striiformis f. sp. tritici]
MVCLRQPIPSLALLRFRPPLVFSTLWSTTAITFTVSKLNSSIDVIGPKNRNHITLLYVIFSSRCLILISNRFFYRSRHLSGLLWPTKIKIAGQQTLSTTLGHQPKPVKIEEIPTKIINNMDPTSQEASLRTTLTARTLTEHAFTAGQLAQLIGESSEQAFALALHLELDNNYIDVVRIPRSNSSRSPSITPSERSRLSSPSSKTSSSSRSGSACPNSPRHGSEESEWAGISGAASSDAPESFNSSSSSQGSSSSGRPPTPSALDNLESDDFSDESSGELPSF